jgi:hypothetical protein
LIHRFRAGIAAAFIAASLVAPAHAQQSSPPKPARDQNQRVCEDIKPTGSRLATKRFCGTRAEWEEKRRLDKEEVEKAQRMPCAVNGTTCK